MNKKIILTVSLVSVIILIIVAVVLTIVFTHIPIEKFEAIYYDNSKIIANKDRFYEKKQTNSWKNNVYETNIEDFTGVKKIKSVVCSDNQSIKINLNIDSGQFKVVLVNTQTKDIYEIANSNINDEIETQIPAGKYDIKIVGIHAKFNLLLDCSNMTF